MPRIINIDSLLKELALRFRKVQLDGGGEAEEMAVLEEVFWDRHTPVQRTAIMKEFRRLREKAGLGGKKVKLPPTPIDLAMECSPDKYETARHIDFLSKKLVKTYRDLGSLLVTMPPRHTKTSTSVQWFSFWALADNPQLPIIYASYEADYAAEWGAKTRDLVIEHGGEYGLKLDPRYAARDNWKLVSGGGMVTAGVGGPLTGKGAGLLLCDDLVKNDIEATSETMRERIDSWVQTVALTRLNPGGAACVFIGTLWHEDDILSRLIKRSNSGEGRHFDVVRLPALAEKDDPLRREEGQALWPEKYPVSALTQIRKSMTSYHWTALYQCRPSPEGGGKIRDAWWQWYTPQSVPSEFDQMLQSWDLSLKVGKGRDPVAGQVWGRSGADFYLLAEAHGELDMPSVIAQCKKWATLFPKAKMKLIEDKAAGPALIQMLRHEAVGGVIPVNPKASKEARVEAILPLIEGRNVFLPKNSDGTLPKWVDEFCNECRAFPQGKHDDRVDAMSQALSRLAPAGWGAVNKAHGSALRDNEKPLTYKESFKKQFWEDHAEETKRFQEEPHGERMGASDPYFGEW